MLEVVEVVSVRVVKLVWVRVLHHVGPVGWMVVVTVAQKLSLVIVGPGLVLVTVGNVMVCAVSVLVAYVVVVE
jgi:hypothetical protein